MSSTASCEVMLSKDMSVVWGLLSSTAPEGPSAAVPFSSTISLSGGAVVEAASWGCSTTDSAAETTKVSAVLAIELRRTPKKPISKTQTTTSTAARANNTPITGGMAAGPWSSGLVVGGFSPVGWGAASCAVSAASLLSPAAAWAESSIRPSPSKILRAASAGSPSSAAVASSASGPAASKYSS